MGRRRAGPVIAAFSRWHWAAPPHTPPMRPAPGRYAAQLCVAVGEAPPDCGPARVDVFSARRLDVRIADLHWRLRPPATRSTWC